MAYIVAGRAGDRWYKARTREGKAAFGDKEAGVVRRFKTAKAAWQWVTMADLENGRCGDRDEPEEIRVGQE